MPLLGSAVSLPAGAQARLKESWAEPFRVHVMGELLRVEERFAGLYAQEGRPNWSVARMLGISLLQQLQDLDDQAALDALSFDVRWQHGLGLSAEEAYLSRRSLVDFRSRLVKHDPRGDLLREVFDRIFEKAAQQLGVCTVQQRLDSTLVCSKIRALGRLSLARETLRVFLRSLEPGQRQRLPAELLVWEAGDEPGWGPPPNEVGQKEQLRLLGRWMAQLLEGFADDKEVCSGEPYQLMRRMVREHRKALLPESAPDQEPEPPGGDAPTPPGSAAPQQEAPSQQVQGQARYWSPHDPDASFGHKGLGYHVHITETCGNEGTELLTDYGVVTAAQSDVGQAPPVVRRLKARGRAPQVLFTDGGYPTPADLVELAQSGTELYAPVHRGRLPVESYTRQDFPRDEQGRVVCCPQGHAPTRHGERSSSDSHHPRRSLYVFFDGQTCRACPDLDQCPVRTPNHGTAREYRLELSAELCARDRRFGEQQRESWQERYQIRCGIEGTISELKRAHGMDQLRVRRLERVLAQVALKATACNIKRWMRLLLGTSGKARASLYDFLAALMALSLWMRRLFRRSPSLHALGRPFTHYTAI